MGEAERNVLDYQPNAPAPTPPSVTHASSTRPRLPYEDGADFTPGDLASSFIVSLLIALGVVAVLLVVFVQFMLPRLLVR